MFTKAIVRRPCKNLVYGITSAELGKPIFERALQQHNNYVEVLEKCGLEVTILPSDENYPDSTFIEDVALLTPLCAIITNPGAPTRQGEIESVLPTLEKFYENIELIKRPGTIEAGDIMMVGSHFYIGISKRTNKAGSDQMIRILNNYGMSGSVLKLKNILHLKTGVVFLENNNILALPELADNPELQKFNIIEVDENEAYAANCVWINDKVLVPLGFPKTKQKIEIAGYETIEVDVSEFRKLDGGLSCLSLRF